MVYRRRDIVIGLGIVVVLDLGLFQVSLLASLLRSLLAHADPKLNYGNGAFIAYQ